MLQLLLAAEPTAVILRTQYYFRTLHLVTQHNERYPHAMVDYVFKLLPSLIVALCLTTAVQADEAQDLLVEKGVAAYDDGDYQRAKDILLPMAKSGHPKAMNMIGLMTKYGRGIPPDHAKACDWYEASANAGYVSAKYNMSICYDGFGRPDNPEMDKAWLLKAASSGHIPATINLATKDDLRGLEYRHWMKRAVSLGSVFAQVSLWYRGYGNDVPNIKARDIFCVTWNIILLDKGLRYCD